MAGSFLSGTSCEREAKELESCNICRTHLQIFCLLKIRRNGSDYAESLLYAHMLETLPSCFKRELFSRKTSILVSRAKAASDRSQGGMPRLDCLLDVTANRLVCLIKGGSF